MAEVEFKPKPAQSLHSFLGQLPTAARTSVQTNEATGVETGATWPPHVLWREGKETGMEARAGGGARGCTAKLSHCSVYKSSQPGDGPRSPNMLEGAPFGPRAERHPEVSGAGHTAVSRVSSIFRELVSCSESILSQLVL